MNISFIIVYRNRFRSASPILLPLLGWVNSETLSKIKFLVWAQILFIRLLSRAVTISVLFSEHITVTEHFALGEG